MSDTDDEKRWAFWQKAKKKLPVLCRLYTTHELSIERLISSYLHVGLLKAHRSLKDYCTRKLATLNSRDSADEPPPPTTSEKLWSVFNWINGKLKNWETDTKTETASEENEEQDIQPGGEKVFIYPQKLTLFIFPQSEEGADKTVEELPEEEPLSPEEMNKEGWEAPTESHRSLRRAVTEKPSFSDYANKKLDLFTTKTITPIQEKSKKNSYVPLVPMPPVLKEEFEKFERQNHFTPLPVPGTFVKPRLVEESRAAFNIPMVLLYAVPVALILVVIFLLCYLLAYVKGKKQRRFVEVEIHRENDDSEENGELSKLMTIGERKTREESYMSDYSKKLVNKSTPMWNSMK